MNRIVKMVLGNLPIVPGRYIKLCKYAQTVGQYPEAEAYAMIRDLLTRGVKAGNIDLQIFGAENIPAEGGLIFYGNHQGLFDIVAAVVANEVPLSAVYKKEIENVPFIREIATCLKGLAMDRSDARQSLQVIQDVTKEVTGGRRYVIFPEGTRSKNGNNMIEFHGGSFRAAIKAKCPVVPMCVIDTYKVFDEKGSKPVDCQLHFLPPIMPEEYEGMKAGELGDMVKERIQSCIDANA